MIGMGERTTPQAVLWIARSLFRAEAARQVLAVKLPMSRSYMHLDTVITMCDRDLVTLFPQVVYGARTWTVRPTYGHSLAICRRVIRTGSCSLPKPGNESMAAITRSQIGAGLALCLMTAAGGPAMAHAMKFLRNARVEPVAFAKLDGWKDDDHAAAFDAFSKSCGAILQGNKAQRTARPIYGALFKVCERASAAGKLDRDQARAFFEDNFKPVRILPEVHTYGYYTGADGFYTGYYEAEVTGSRGSRPRTITSRSTACRQNSNT